MIDLVESVIAQVIKQPYDGPVSDPPKAAPSHARQIKTYAASPHASFDPDQIKDKALWGVCCKFEAIFVQQMMTAMRKSVPQSGFLPHGFAESMHDSMMDQAITENGTRQGGMGIALQMYRQLESVNTGRDMAIQGIQQVADKVAMDIDYHGQRGSHGSD
ncbi:MAG: rod-binding protein [Mariprofundus sp.]